MKILFLTTYNVFWEEEHYFTQNVSLSLFNQIRSQNIDQFIVATISDREKPDVTRFNNQKEIRPFENLHIKIHSHDKNIIIKLLIDFFQREKPDIIHSQMIEGYDIEAAKRLNIPIVNTIHIGGFICPRGGGDGFLKYDDSICSQPIGKDCAKCMVKKLPFPALSYFLHKITPHKLKLKLRDRMDRNIFYLTPFLNLTRIPEERKNFIELAKYSHKIIANPKLLELFKINGISENLHLIPHGVKYRKKIDLPDIKGPIKFYYLARVQYSKGLHIVIEALKGIPNNLYELHIIGDTTFSGKKGKEYFEKIKKEASNLNIYYDGRINNDEIDFLIANYHVMIHPAIFHEVYGIAIAESLSMGRPVLATRCGGAEIQVIDGYNGWLIKPNDIEEMHNKILHIINHKEEIIEFSNNSSLPHPLTEYTEILLKLYKTIIDQKLLS